MATINLVQRLESKEEQASISITKQRMEKGEAATQESVGDTSEESTETDTLEQREVLTYEFQQRFQTPTLVYLNKKSPLALRFEEPFFLKKKIFHSWQINLFISMEKNNVTIVPDTAKIQYIPLGVTIDPISIN